MTPTQAAPGETPVTLTSHKACVEVIAPACTITPECKFGDNGMHNYIVSYYNEASYNMSVWCEPGALSFSWTQ